MWITGGFGALADWVTGRPSRWYMRADGIKRWVSTDLPCDMYSERARWRCTKCARVGLVARCCGEDTREPVEAPTPEITRAEGVAVD